MQKFAAASLGLALVSGCRGAAPSPAPRPGRRDITITTVPFLSRELVTTYPFLQRDFAAGGVLDGKEVYAFIPGTITVMVGDTLHLTLLNPEDDAHAFVLHDLYLPLPPQSRIDTTYVAHEPGIFTFSCSVPQHLPMMRGELVVLDRDRLAAR
jgi:plastocyanin